MRRSSMDRDPKYLLDMLVAGRRIQTATKGRSQADFESDPDLHDIVCWQFCVIGEAAGRVSEDFRERHSSLPWRSIIGIRNRLIHSYDVIDPNIVWKVVEAELPELVRLLQTYVEEEDRDGHEDSSEQK
jgi:uncharacterized protein with HEPN domain